MFTSKCPFLGKVSSKFLQHSGSSLGVYAQNCPVMSRLFTQTATLATAAANSTGTAVIQQAKLGKIMNKIMTTLNNFLTLSVFPIIFIYTKLFFKFRTALSQYPQQLTSLFYQNWAMSFSRTATYTRYLYCCLPQFRW